MYRGIVIDKSGTDIVGFAGITLLNCLGLISR